MPTKFARRRVYISFSGFEEPVEALILSSFKDCGAYYYRIKLIDGGKIFDVQVRSVDWIAHRKSKVVQLPKKIKLVK